MELRHRFVRYVLEKWRTIVFIATSSDAKRRATREGIHSLSPAVLPPRRRYSRLKRVGRRSTHQPTRLRQQQRRIALWILGSFAKKSAANSLLWPAAQRMLAATKDAFNGAARLAPRIRLSILKTRAHTSHTLCLLVRETGCR